MRRACEAHSDVTFEEYCQWCLAGFGDEWFRSDLAEFEVLSHLGLDLQVCFLMIGLLHMIAVKKKECCARCRAKCDYCNRSLVRKSENRVLFLEGRWYVVCSLECLKSFFLHMAS